MTLKKMSFFILGILLEKYVHDNELIKYESIPKIKRVYYIIPEGGHSSITNYIACSSIKVN